MIRVNLLLTFLCLVTNVDALHLVTNNSMEVQEHTVSNAHLQKMAKIFRAFLEKLKQDTTEPKTGELTTQDRVRLKSMPKLLTQAHNFLLEKQALVTAHKRNRALRNETEVVETSDSWPIVGSIIDAALILVTLFTEKSCTLLVMLYWWIVGLFTMKKGQGLEYDDAFSMLGQLVTTVGYGTDPPDEEQRAMKIWHALHGLLGVLAVADPTYQMIHTEFMKNIITGNSKVPRFTPLLVTTLASAVGYAFDLQESAPVSGKKYPAYFLDALYMTIITLTTIGYGDISPGTKAGKVTSVPWMIFSTDLFAQSFQGEDGEENYMDKSSIKKCPQPPDMSKLALVRPLGPLPFPLGLRPMVR